MSVDNSEPVDEEESPAGQEKQGENGSPEGSIDGSESIITPPYNPEDNGGNPNAASDSHSQNLEDIAETFGADTELGLSGDGGDGHPYNVPLDASADLDQNDPGVSEDSIFDEESTDSESDSSDKSGRKSLVVAKDVLPPTLPIIPLTQKPLFPGTIFPLMINGSELINSLRSRLENGELFAGVVLTKDSDAGQDAVDEAMEEASKEASPKDNQDPIQEPTPDAMADGQGGNTIGIDYVPDKTIRDEDLYEIGTVVKIHKFAEMDSDDGDPKMAQILVQTLRRFRKAKLVTEQPNVIWKVEYYPEDPKGADEELKAYTMAIISAVKDLLKLNPLFQEQLKLLITQLSYDDPGKIMDLIASMTTAEAHKLQTLLETVPLKQRADRLMVILREEIQLSRLQEKIRKSIEEKISKQQKEFFLHEQLKAIKKELGLEKDDKTAEIDKFQERLDKLTLPEEVAKVVAKEIDTLKMLEPASPEYHVSRNYLDWLSLLPWGITTEDNFDLRKAAQILDRDHYGLEDIKDEILEFISVGQKRGELGGSILLFVGPPGVGKTSIGRSIAEALGRKFFRFSVGGMRDEAEIKGHRRTYIGAMPGKFIQCLKSVGSSNPVIMLDEIDKIGTSFRGDPASALLEVLDPEQNKDFLDHFLDVRFDLSQVLFIATANQLDTIPGPLLDRMSLLKLSGYIHSEKKEIAKRYLIPKALKDFGYKEDEVAFSDESISKIITDYAREAGVRSLEKNLRKILRKVTLKVARDNATAGRVEEQDIQEYLGMPIFQREVLYNKDKPGVALGLAWTQMGGATLYVEATRYRSSDRGGYRQTGQLGDVMKESSEIAYSFVRGLLTRRAGAKAANFFKNNFIHLHVPAGATPKDGPSAGITMALAIYSLATGKVVRPDIAMTGELTLTGKVLPIGGVKEKVIAAKRVGISQIILPEENRKDYAEVPDKVKDGVTVHFVNYFADVLEVVYIGITDIQPDYRSTNL